MPKVFRIAALACLPSFAASGSPIDACALLSDGEIRDTVGRDFHDGERHDSGEFVTDTKSSAPSYSSTCLWRIGPSDDGTPLAETSFVMVNAIRWSSGREGSKHYLQSFRDAAEDGVIDQDPDALEIGEEALWWGDGVALRKGGKSVGVSVHLRGERRNERALEEYLAKVIAGRL